MVKKQNIARFFISTFVIFSIFTSIFMINSFADNSSEETEDTGTVFTDIPEGAYYEEAVYFVNERGIMKGTASDKFSPNSDVTRQQVWMCLARLSGENPQNMDEAKAWAVDKEVSDGSNPTGKISRQELATMLYNYAFNFGYDTSKQGSLISYRDCNMVEPWAEVALQWAIANKIINGTGNYMLDPTGNATRAQFSTILMRFMQNYDM